MVDFSKRLGKAAPKKLLNPEEIYETLDRMTEKGPLRPVQKVILAEWYARRRENRDTILKLHTGQGKTLIGLLILQSKLNETGEPAVYLCPNRFLINQTCTQAKQFGISHCTAEGDLPSDFLEGKSLLITSVQKLFNGLTKFGLGPKSLAVGTLLMDDAHACIDAVRDAFLIRIEKSEAPFVQLLDLFSDDLQHQGMGTYADIRNHKFDALLPIPYWTWADKHHEVAHCLSKAAHNDSIKFAWPILKDMLADCQCVVSGRAVEIGPHAPPLHLFGSYSDAKHRVFMSATVTDDSFLVKGLRLAPDTIRNPLIYEKERWSGEKMVLIPSLIDESLTREIVVEKFAKPSDKRKFGVVALVPSDKGSSDWKAYGSTVADKNSIDEKVAALKNGQRQNTLVIVNRYDGIDLPDDSCRILIFDSKPYAENLIEQYAEGCRASSNVTLIRAARTIEQGLGRSVRGEKDYCVIILIGIDLVRSVRTKELRQHLSEQTRAQIEVGLEIAGMSREEVARGTKPIDSFFDLCKKCLSRDADWKAFYAERMDAVVPRTLDSAVLDIFQQELVAEERAQAGDVAGAVATIQQMIDRDINSDLERGWYLQEMARYQYRTAKEQSNTLQLAAHSKNRFVLKPRQGMQVKKIQVISQKRMEWIIDWITQFDRHAELMLAIDDLLARLSFGVNSDTFERTLNDLSKALGFEGERPDKEWGEGPDNLWGIRDGEFIVYECKNEVELDRAEIHKTEAEQMNRSIAWFQKYYAGSAAKNILIIPPKKLASAAAFLGDVCVMRDRDLGRLKENVRKFFLEFASYDLNNLSEHLVQRLVDAHDLSVDAVRDQYCSDVVSVRRPT